MKLYNSEGEYLNLSIQAYQFPENTDCYWDANWLTIKGEVQLGKKVWSFQDPCMLSFEALRLLDWLNSVSLGTPKEQEICFLEPNLEFEITDENKLRIYFELESRPSWAPYDAAGMGDLFLDLELHHEMLKTAINVWRTQLSAYPVRALHDK